MLAVLGTLALVLAGVGMYGVIAYHVTARTREIGIRMAIGASPGDVYRMVIGQGLRVTMLGIVIGLVLSAMAARLLASLLYGVSPTDAVRGRPLLSCGWPWRCWRAGFQRGERGGSSRWWRYGRSNGSNPAAHIVIPDLGCLLT